MKSERETYAPHLVLVETGTEPKPGVGEHAETKVRRRYKKKRAEKRKKNEPHLALMEADAERKLSVGIALLRRLRIPYS